MGTRNVLGPHISKGTYSFSDFLQEKEFLEIVLLRGLGT